MEIIKDLIERVKKFPPIPNAINDKQPDGAWTSITFQEFVHQIEAIAATLVALGIKQGDKVAVFGPPTSRWVIADMAIMRMGGVAVPIYTSVSNENFATTIRTSGAKVIFVAGQEQHNFCKNHYDLFDHLIALDNAPPHLKIHQYKDVLEKGNKALMKNPDLLNIDVKSTDLGMIVFSSGSTSVPKGVELTQGCILSLVEINSGLIGHRGTDDTYLNFLPFSHIFGFLYNLTILNMSARMYYERDVTQIAKDCQEVHPTIMIVVPRILEKIYSSIQKKIKDSSWLPRKLGSWALKLAQKQHFNLLDKLLYPFANLILYSKIRRMLGGRLRVVSLGSARSDPEMLWFYYNVGIPIFEGYGLTESCPITTNYPGNNVIGTVGEPSPTLEVKISSEGEILVRGPNVMRGYYMDPEATKAAIDAEGWLHTRDQGEFDKTGRLIFINRFDDRTKTSYGIYVDVPKIEILLNRLPFVNFSVVVANEKPYATCLIFPNFEVIDNLKKQLNLENLADDKLLNIAFMRKTVDQAIKELNDKLDKQEHILGYRFIWDRNDTGFLTQTMKIKRSYVLEKYKNLIAEMYPVKTIRL